MKLVFRTTPAKIVNIPSQLPPPIIFSNTYKDTSPNALLTKIIFAGNMIDRVKPNGEPCGSCGGR